MQEELASRSNEFQRCSETWTAERQHLLSNNESYKLVLEGKQNSQRESELLHKLNHESHQFVEGLKQQHSQQVEKLEGQLNTTKEERNSLLLKLGKYKELFDYYSELID